MKNNTLRIGDLVILQGSFQSDPETKKTNPKTQESGFLSAIGFTDNRVFIQTVPPGEKDKVEGAANLSNYEELVFQVWPKVSYNAHKQMKKLEAEKARIDKGTDEEKEVFEQRMKKASDRVEQEIEENENMLGHLLGLPVIYGNEYQFMHYVSREFLTSRVTCSDSDSSAYKFELTKQYNSGMAFKILPRYQIRKEGDNVLLDDQVLIKSSKLKCFVNYSTEQNIEMDNRLGTSANTPVISAPFEHKTLSSDSKRYEAYISQFRDCVWKFHYHGDPRKEDEKGIRGGDLVKIKATEIEAYLAADVPMRGKNPEVYGRRYVGEYEQEENSANTLWEIEVINTIYRGGICPLNNTEGKRQPIRLRHFLTGKILCIDDGVSVASDFRASLAVVRDEQNQMASVIFHPFTKTSSNEIQYEISYGIAISVNKSEYKFMQTLDKVDYTQKEQKNQMQSPSHHRSANNETQIFKPLQDEELSTEKKVIVCENKIPFPEHAFRLIRVSPEEERNARHVASSIQTLRHFRDLNRAYVDPQTISPHTYKRTLEVLQNLIFFVHKSTENTAGEDPITFQGKTEEEKQRLMKDCRIIELLTEILYYPFFTKRLSLDGIKEGDFKKILQCCYRLIMHTIKEYRPNEIYAAQWLEHYMYQAMNADEERADIKAQATLIELIDNNERILDTKINKDMISRFVHMLEASKKQKFVKLLKALCVCNGEPVVKNQTSMSRAIIEEVSVRDKLLYHHIRKTHQGVLEIQYQVEEVEEDLKLWVPLSEFKNANKTDYEYFLSMIQLLSDLCLKRNYVAIDYLENIYTYEICYDIIAGDFEAEIRSAFAILIINLWIDRRPYEPLNVPDYLIMWNGLNPSSCSKIASSEGDLSKFEGLRIYLKTYFENLAKKHCNRIYELDSNKFTLILLDVTYKMVSFGLYKELTQLKDLLKPLMILMNGMADVMTAQDYESFKRRAKKDNKVKKGLHFTATDDLGGRNTDRYEENEKTSVVMECKSKILDIVKKTLDINDDFLMRKFLLEFRNESDRMREFGSNESENNVSALSDKRSLFSHETSRHPNNEPQSPGVESFPKLLKFMKSLSEKNAINLNELAPTNFVRILFDLCLYKNDSLVNNAFELLYNTHSQRRRLLDILEQVHILEDVQNKTVVLNLKQDRKLLNELAEATEKWYGQKDPESLKQTGKCLEIIKKFRGFLTSESIALLDGQPRASSPIKNKRTIELGDGEEMEEEEEEENYVDIEYQKILKHLKVYEPMLDILRYEVATSDDEKTKYRSTVLKAVFKFLTKFVQGQKKTQNLLSQEMKLYLIILESYPGCGAERFIQEMFKGNRHLVKQFEVVQKFSQNIMQIIIRLGISNSESAKLLSSLKWFMKVKDQIVKPNQTTILSLMTSKEYASLFITLDSDKKKVILDKLEAVNQQMSENKNGLVQIPGEIDYLSSTLEIMAYTCDGKNAITESKSQTSWPLKDLLLLYRSANNFWLLKRSILLFVYHVYLDTEKAMKEGNDLHNILKEMINDMKKISQTFKKEYSIQYHNGVISNKKAQEKFYFGALLPCVNEILAKKFYASLNNYRQVLEEMYSSLQDMRDLDVNPTQRKEIVTILDKFKSHLQQDSKFMRMATQAERTLVEHPIERRVKREGSDGFGSAVGKEENPRNMKLKLRLAMISQHKDFSEAVEKEFKALIKILIHIEKPRSDIYSCVIPFGDLIKSLIQLFDVTGTHISKELMIVGLRMFRRIIEIENKKDHRPAIEWESDQWSNYKKKIIQRQNQLCELGLVEMVCNILSECNPNDTELQYESLLMGITLLIGGNNKIQKKILEYTQNDCAAQNKFFCSIKELIERNFSVAKKEMSMKNKIYAATSDQNEEDKLALKSAPPAKSHTSKLDDLPSPTINLNETKLENKQAPTSVILGKSQEIDEATEALQILENTYRFLQLFCEGHYLELQNQLRLQKDGNGNESGKSQDFIKKTAQFFNSLIKQINIDSIDFCTRMLDFLIEAIQGPCEANQKALAKAKIIHVCMDFLTAFKQDRDYNRQGFVSEEEKEKVDDATTTAMKLLSSLIEGNNDPEILEDMGHLDFRFLISKLGQEYKDLIEDNLKLNPEYTSPAEVTSRLRTEHMTQQVLESFDVYILIRTIADSNEKVAEYLKVGEDYTALEVDALEFFRRNVGNVEIYFKEKLLIVYFPIHPVCQYLSQDTQKEFMLNVSRGNRGEKINGLVEAAPNFILEMKHMVALQNWYFVFSPVRYNLLRDFSTLLSFVINFIILCTYYYSVVSGYSTIQIKSMGELNTSRAIDALGYMQVVASSLMILFWIIINGPIILRRKWEEQARENRKHVENDEKNDEDQQLEEDPDPELLSLRDALDLLNNKGPYDPMFNSNGSRNFGHFFVRLAYYWNNLKFIVTDGTFVFVMFYTAVSIMGLAISEIIYCLHMLDVINRFDTLKNVTKAVTKNLRQLLLTSVLGLILIYIYSLIGYYFLDETYYNANAGNSGERSCTSMFHCYVTTMNYGLRNGGGIGESLTFESYVMPSRLTYFFRLIFDLTFFIVINVVFLKVIFGIIIDAFRDLRDEKTERDDDIKGVCFICGAKKHNIEKSGERFEKHIEKHHLLWNYVNFMYSIGAKDVTEYNGVESYVAEKLKHDDIIWFPANFEAEDSTEE